MAQKKELSIQATTNNFYTDWSANPMLGYSIVTPENMDEALDVAKGNPFLELGGAIEVAEIMQMNSK